MVLLFALAAVHLIWTHYWGMWMMLYIFNSSYVFWKARFVGFNFCLLGLLMSVILNFVEPAIYKLFILKGLVSSYGLFQLSESDLFMCCWVMWYWMICQFRYFNIDSLGLGVWNFFWFLVQNCIEGFVIDGVKLGTIKSIKVVSVYELRDGVALELKFNLRDPVDCYFWNCIWVTKYHWMLICVICFGVCKCCVDWLIGVNFESLNCYHGYFILY